MARRIIDLSVPIENFSYEGFPPEVHFWTHREGARALAKPLGLKPDDFPDGIALAWESFHGITHAGTHFDAPWHFGPTSQGKPSKTIDQVPLEWCFGDGVRLDLRHKKPETNIGAADIEAALKKINYTVKPFDIPLIWTDADKYLEDPSYDKAHPGMSEEATMYLLERGVKVIGTDGYGYDRSFVSMGRDYLKGDKAALWPGHFTGRKKEYCHVESMGNLDKLPVDHGFKVAVFPVLIPRASAGWTRAVAIIED